MAATAEEICNIALSYIGNREFIVDLINEDTLPALVARVHYNTTRDQVLREHPWNFATRHASLAQLAITVPSGWTYAYSLPADCLKHRYIYAGGRKGTYDAEQRVPFIVERHPSAPGKVLLTDHASPELVYTSRVNEVPDWPDDAQDALAWLLAPKFAMGLAVQPQIGAQMLREGYVAALSKAIASDLNGSQPDVEPTSEFQRGR